MDRWMAGGRLYPFLGAGLRLQKVRKKKGGQGNLTGCIVFVRI
jgi:hypothetical protein